MTLTEKLIIPLIDEEMKPEYVSRDSGFIALYTKDKNRPSLYMHIFLMYEFNKGISLYNTFKGFKTFYGSNCIFIDNVCYYLFTFVMNNECKNLIKGLFPHETKSLLRLLSFWNSDQEIANKIISNEGTFKFEENEVPEEDYRRGGYNDIQEYIGLRIQKGLTPELGPVLLFFCGGKLHIYYYTYDDLRILNLLFLDFLPELYFGLTFLSSFWKMIELNPRFVEYLRRESSPGVDVSSNRVGIPVGLNIDLAA